MKIMKIAIFSRSEAFETLLREGIEKCGHQVVDPAEADRLVIDEPLEGEVAKIASLYEAKIIVTVAQTVQPFMALKFGQEAGPKVIKIITRPQKDERDEILEVVG